MRASSVTAETVTCATVKLLVLGGTKFLGRAAVEAALARGDEVTLFNRGETNPELFPEAEKLRGDRDGDLSALEGREWDAVIDPSGYVPRVVRASAELLQRSVGHYLFVSSASVYAEPYEPGFDESAPVLELDDPESADVMKHDGFLQMSVSKAVAAGLRFRPLEETARDTLARAREEGEGLVTVTQYGTAGLDPAREAELLAAWHGR